MMTESRIKEIIRESVDKVLNEEKKSTYGPNGYRIVKGGMDFTVDGEKIHSVVSVVTRSGRQAYHVSVDDHCYVIYAEWEGKSHIYQCPYIFDELLDAIKTLPIPS